MQIHEIRTEKVSLQDRSEGRQEVETQNHAGTAGEDAGCAPPKKKSRSPNPEGSIGVRYNKLIVRKILGVNKGGHLMVMADCDCGTETKGALSKVRSGWKKSCGCHKIELISRRQRTHGLSETRAYNSWRGMIRRCTDPKHQNFTRYQSLGVAVCERWMKFENFLADMGQPPAGMSIERKENHLGYFKENCKWATRIEQQNNTRTNHLIEANGETHTIAEWSRITGIPHSAIRGRIQDRGWDGARAVTTPVRMRRKPSTAVHHLAKP